MRTVTSPLLFVVLFSSSVALADATTAQQNGSAPTDESAAVTQQKESGTLPAENKPVPDSTAGAVNAGMQLATGNSQLLAVTGGGKIDLRRGHHGFGAAILGNYAEAYAAPVAPATQGTWSDTTRNLQGKLRYDFYFERDWSAFLQVTGTHDAFQATTFRLNIDPGIKYLFINHEKTKLWAELGYDFEFDDNYVDSNGFEQAGAGGKVSDATSNLPIMIVQTNTMHSLRAFAGFRHAFSKEVTLSAGLEYLQGLGGSGDGLPNLPAGFTDAEVSRQKLTLTRSRVNFDALFAAHVAGGLSLGVGFTAKYNSNPLPGKQDVDTTTTLSLIYAFTSSNKDKKEPPPPPPPCTPCMTAPITPPITPPPSDVAASYVALDGVTFNATGELDAMASKDALNRLVDTLKMYPNVKVHISSPNATTQADAIRSALVAAGADGARIVTETREGKISVRISTM